MQGLTATKETYYIAHNNNDVFHVGKLEIGNRLDTGQDNLETFFLENEFINRCSELGISYSEPLEQFQKAVIK